MQLFGRLSDFFNNINPSTLTGAVDVVVVEDVATGRLTCSPFHVRFGKLQVLRPSEKKVDLEVNGKPIDGVSMKIGLAGETFFVLPVDGPVPSEYQTSPLPAPISASPRDVPHISLTSPSKGLIEPLSDSELDAARKERRRPSKVALSDSEIDAGSGAGGPDGEDEWTWKWGDLPTKDTPSPHPIDHEDQEIIDKVAHVDEPTGKMAYGMVDKVTRLENDILDQPAPEVNGQPPSEVKGQPPSGKDSVSQSTAPAPPLILSTVCIGSYLRQRETIEMMYSRLEQVISEGIDEVELCLLSYENNLQVKPADLTVLKNVQETFRTVSWDQFRDDPECLLGSSLICIFGPSTKCAIFPTKGALQLLIGLRLYKKLFPLDKLLNLVDLERPGANAELQPKSESILSWRQWWSSPKSQSSKTVPAASASSPTKNIPSLSASMGQLGSPAKSVLGNTAAQAVASLPDPSLQRANSTPDLSTGTTAQNYAKSLRLPSTDLQKLNLHYGMNTIKFSVMTSKNGQAFCTSRIFLWRSDEKVVISDIDGTITKSDALGHLFQIVGKDWTHLGVANLYTDIGRNGYRFLYLTSRPIGQATQTRSYLRGVEQDRYQLPEGPVIMSPDRFFMAMRREVIEGNPEQFKIPCLLDIRRLFYPRPLDSLDPMSISEEEKAMTCPFYAGFGNRLTDAMSYQAVGINPSRIYIINPSGDLSLHIISGYRSSYVKLVDLVDNVFPPINAAIERDRLVNAQLRVELEKERQRAAEAASLQSGDPTKFKIVPPQVPPRPTSIHVPPIQEIPAESEEFNDFFFWKQPSTLPDPTQYSYLASPSLIPLSTSDMLMLVGDNAGAESPSGPALDDETSSERGDHYYFEEREEAGLIPFA